MAADKNSLEQLGSRAIMALRAAFPDTDGPETAAFREAVEAMTAALVSGGVRTPVIDQAILRAVDAYADMPARDKPLSMQGLAELAEESKTLISAAPPTVVEQIRAIKAQLATEPSLQIRLTLQHELEDAAAELADVKLTKAVVRDSGRAPSGIFLATMGNPVRDAQALVTALHTAMPGRNPEVLAMRSALEAVATKLYSNGVGGAVIGDALGEALDVYVTISPSDLVKAVGADVDPASDPLAGYVLAFPNASDAEADELIKSLRDAGNVVLRVEGDVAQSALADAMNSAGIEPGDLEP